MNYLLYLSEEERNLMIIDLFEMVKDEGFYDKDLATKILYKILYAKREN